MCGTRWKRSKESQNTDLDTDTSFYIGAKVESWYSARRSGLSVVEAFEALTPLPIGSGRKSPFTCVVEYGGNKAACRRMKQFFLD